MKQILLYLFLVSAFLFVFSSCNTNKGTIKEAERYTPNANEELYGTWSNPEYNEDSSNYAKMVFFQNDVFLGWSVETNPQPKTFAAYTIYKKWIDDQKNIFYTMHGRSQINVNAWILIKISNSGFTLEWVDNKYPEFPERIDTENLYYKLLYRQ